MIKLSICIPTYNRGDLLNKTLSYLLPQLDQSICEVVISDNNSSDHTIRVVEDYIKQYQCIRYFKNSENIGLDNNTLESIIRAQGEYCWLCSDDDIPLPGSFNKIESIINQYSPNLIYLHHAGYLENEDFNIVYLRNSDKEDIVYYDGEIMLRDLLLNHLSSIVIKRKIAIQFFDVVHECRALNFERGYSLIIAPYTALMTKGPFVFVGKLCVAVRNPLKGNNYNPLTILTDVARNHQLLTQKGLIKEATENEILNRYVKTFYKLILPIRCKGDPYFTKEWSDMAIMLCKKYKSFYFFLYPCLVFPRWLLFVPYIIGRTIKRTLRKYANISPF
jgi:glycosyltransferase involved in cell wall biosynthesis